MDNSRLVLHGPTIPKIIWMSWLQGWDEASPLIRACRESWQRQNPGWDVRAIDGRDAVDLVGTCPVPDKLPAARSDVMRARLLSEFGGVWADATTFCTTPLDGWLDAVAASGFFAFDTPGYGRMLSSWFLAATPHSHVMARWTAEIDRYWAHHDEPDEYFWFHRIFAKLYNADENFRLTWDTAPRVSADGPHYFAPYTRNFTGPLTRRASARLAGGRDPIYKLTNHVDVTDVASDSACAYFLEGARWGLKPSSPWDLLDRGTTLAKSDAKKWVNRARAVKARVGRTE